MIALFAFPVSSPEESGTRTAWKNQEGTITDKADQTKEYVLARFNKS